MGAHSQPGSPRVGVTRLAGTGVMAALALAGSAGVASAHGVGHDQGHGHGGDGDRREASRIDDAPARTAVADPNGACAVLDDLDIADLPGLDCSEGASPTYRSTPTDATGGTTAVTPTSSHPSGTRGTSTEQADATTPADTASSATTQQAAQESTPQAAQDSTQQSPQAPASPQPRTTGNPIDAPGAPGTTRTLPIGG